ncbi:MAG: L-fucose/L-arabinose isomerase family protein [Anaerolineae bacterium]
MTEGDKPQVGLLGLMLESYDSALPELRVHGEAFAGQLVANMSPFAQVHWPGMCNTRTAIQGTIEAFEQQGVDLVLVVMLTYATSLTALPALRRTKLPLLIFNTQAARSVPQDAPPSILAENHGMHGVQDLANVLLRAGRSFALLTGHWQDPDTLAELQRWCDAARVARALSRCRIGLLGYPMQDMGDFGIDETALLAQVGAQSVHIPFSMVARLAQQAPPPAIANMVVEDHARFDVDPGLSCAEHEAALRLEWALRQVVAAWELNGLAVHFQAVDEDGRLETLPFLAASKMLADGLAYGGEGDVTSAVAVALMQALAGRANFTEMFTMDFDEQAIVMSHMGEGNWQMARRDRPVRLVRNAFPMASLCYAPAALSFALEPGHVTLASLTTGPEGRLRLVVGEGDILDFLPFQGAANPQYKLMPAGGLRRFLTGFSLAGGSHHQALAYGSHTQALQCLASLLGIECIVVP